MTEKRPDPYEILRKNFPQDGNSGRGKLKIFFGYAAGVGKSYSMLEAAREEIKAGRDVAVGYIELHDRPDTLALLNGLEVLPSKWIGYKGIELREFDLDGTLLRHPQLALVDELAHTNAPGCRHKKRYQDIMELLAAGIDVYTTVNVQHLESLHDIVASITHIKVSERIPDQVFDMADQVELVDIAPEELRRRLEEGKIYHKEQAARAAENFFTVENLSALREIALRRTADRVNREVSREREAGGKEYYTGEHVLVCLSPSPTNAKVIRTAARMASAFHAEFTAVLVETAELKENRAKISRKMEENIALAKQFGANVLILYGEDVVEQIAGYAKRNGISKIVIGRTVRGPRRFFFPLRPTLIDRLIKQVPSMDIYVIPDSNAKPRKLKNRIGGVLGGRQGIEWAKTVFILAAVTVLALVLAELGAAEVNVVMLYIVGVIVVAYSTKGRRFGVVASMAAVLLFNYFFTEPRFTFEADAAYYPFTFGAMLCCALVTSTLAGRLKDQATISEKESRYMQVLLNITRRMNQGSSVDEVLETCGKQVRNLLNKNIVVYDTINGTLGTKRYYSLEGQDETAREMFGQRDEEAVALWVLNHRQKAGRSTDTLPGARARYIPVYKEQKVFAVIGVELKEDETILPNDKNVLTIIAAEAASRMRDLLEMQETAERNAQNGGGEEKDGDMA